MALRLNTEQLYELMRSFYTITGIRCVLFDTEFHAVVSYPGEDCAFCRLMKSCPATRQKCMEADQNAFAQCVQSDAPVIYHCHAGLVEAVFPLHENGKVFAYLMFGQIIDQPDKAPLYDRANQWSQQLGQHPDLLKEAIRAVIYKDNAGITSAAKIMEACTGYILFKELITPENHRLMEAAKEYIESHLGEDITPTHLCRHLQISRTKLYDLFRREQGQGISAYILRRRMHRAKKLLKTTELTIKEISRQVGFTDYNYFSRVFKKIYGRSPRKYR